MTDTVVVPAVEQEQSAEEIAKLVAVAESGEVPKETPPADTQPLILGKFKTAEELAQAYTELEKKVTPPEVPEADEPPPQGELEIKPKEEATEPEQFNFEKYAEHYAKSGELTEDHFKELSERGLPRNIVDVYLAGVKALQTQTQNEAYGLVGGQEVYASMIQWAGSNLQPGEIDAFNKAVAGSPEQRSMAITALKSRYAETREAPLLGGRSAPASASAFTSWGEVQTAMADKRYGRDAAYTKDVEQRLAGSRF